MLRALSEYYDCLTRQPNSPLAPDGFSKVTVNYNIVLTKSGELKEILPYVRKITVGKKEKEVGREELFPFRFSVHGIFSETIEMREKYTFGIDWDKKESKLVSIKNSLLAFEKNKEKNLEFLGDIESPVVNAYKNFLNNWNPENEINNPVVKAMGKDYSGAKFIVTLEGENNPLNRDSKINEKWQNFWNNKPLDKDAVIGQCSISGKVGEIARIHDKLDGFKEYSNFGSSLVTNNEISSCSYNKGQSYNSSVSQEVMEKYTKAFNYLASSPQHKQVLDDTTLLYFALTDKDETPYTDTFNFSLFGASFSDSDDNVDLEKDKREGLENKLNSIFRHLSEGKEDEWQSLNIDKNVQFCLLAVKPNSSRLSIKMFERNSFGNLMQNAALHAEDMRFNENDKQIPLWSFQNALKSSVGNTEIQPDLSVKILESILTGKHYPHYLLDTVVMRAKTDQDDETKNFKLVNRTRARIIKACLTRLKTIERGEFNMLNEQCKDSAYNCGRLFAVLEMLQSSALGANVNATIKDKFFASACSTPYLVFPRLLVLAQNHIKKISSSRIKSVVNYDKLIGNILNKLSDEFPKTLNLEKQGTFILGYYQQREKIFVMIENAKAVKAEKGED